MAKKKKMESSKQEKQEEKKSFNLFEFIYYNFISYKEERSIFFSGICRGVLYYFLFAPVSNFLFSMDTTTTFSGLLCFALILIFAYIFFMQFGYAIIYTLGFHAEYIDPSRIVERSGSSSGGSYGNINSSLEYGDAIMSQKNTFGKVEYLKENPHMLLKKDSENVKSALKYIDTMVGMKPSGESRAKELKKYYKD